MPWPTLPAWRLPRWPGLPARREDPDAMLLRACQLGDPGLALAEGERALGLGADPRARLGSRDACGQALAHGNGALARAILARSGRANVPDDFGWLPLERLLCDGDVPRQAKAPGVAALLAAGADPGGSPARIPPLARALDEGLDECARALAAAMDLDASSPLPWAGGAPLAAAALSCGAELCSRSAFDALRARPEGPAWLSRHAMALCLCCLGSSRPDHARARWLVDLPMAWLTSGSAAPAPTDALLALRWLSMLPWTDKGGSARACDGDPAFEALLALASGCPPPPGGACRALEALGAPPSRLALGLASCESMALACDSREGTSGRGARRL